MQIKIYICKILIGLTKAFLCGILLKKTRCAPPNRGKCGSLLSLEGIKTMLKIYLIVCGVMSLLTFCLYGRDKRKAKRDRRRIPELTLLTFAALGGGVGALLGMLLFRHKTNIKRKAHFVLGVPLVVLSQIALLLLMLFT